jgi:hydroxymethylpyrimidine pyrophosphatase-like HAD family hydrolase
MQFRVLACDYDGTLAHDGHVDAPVRSALERLLASGRLFVLVTGRELDELLAIFPQIDFCADVVVENGALLYSPKTKEQRVLSPPPDASFIEALRRRGVAPISVGRSIVATWRPHEHAVFEAIEELKLDLKVIFNKDAVMVLPGGVNKASGLKAVLERLRYSPHDVVGVGDAENDQSFLSICGYSAAVANAVPSLRERVHWVTRGVRGAGVVELIDRIIAGDLPKPMRDGAR